MREKADLSELVRKILAKYPGEKAVFSSWFEKVCRELKQRKIKLGAREKKRIQGILFYLLYKHPVFQRNQGQSWKGVFSGSEPIVSYAEIRNAIIENPALPVRKIKSILSRKQIIASLGHISMVRQKLRVEMPSQIQDLRKTWRRK